MRGDKGTRIEAANGTKRENSAEKPEIFATSHKDAPTAKNRGSVAFSGRYGNSGLSFFRSSYLPPRNCGLTSYGC